MTTRALEGRVSLVTGAGRGIGRATSVALARAGSAVVLGARTVGQLDEVASEIREQGGRALATPLDVTDLESVRRFVNSALGEYGQIDVLVNNAGSNNGGEHGAIGPLWEIDPGAWWRDVEVNLRGTFHCAHVALSHMVARGEGRIVNVTSQGPATLPWPYNSAYASSKAGGLRLTDSLAAELRDHGVFVFALSPGRVKTQLLGQAMDTEAGRTWLAPLVAGLPNAEIPPEVPAEAVVFLASGRADALTGRLLRAGWDLEELAGRAAGIVERDGLALRLTPAG